MKKYITLFILLLTLVSCEQFKEVTDVPVIANISASVAVTSNAVASDVPRPDTYTVKFINYDDNYEVAKTTDANGKVSVADIIPGIYTVTVTGDIAYKGFTYYYSGSIVNEKITTSGNNFTIDVNASKAGDLIIKEIYYNGSTGYYFKDQFYEIYNNGEEIQYVDGLCIGTLLPLTATTATYNWQVPDGMPENYVYFGVIWQAPGSGTDYPVLPGESVIIAQLAHNHTAADKNPLSPVDLSGADFETFIKNQTVNADNPNAINMEHRFGTVYGTQWLATVFGAAYCIFFPDGEIDPNTYVQPTGKTDKSKNIPIDLIVDGVELVNNATKITYKRMPTTLDAGATFTGGTYNGKSVSRRIKETLSDGRVIYWDTNNSTDDFQVNDAAMVRRNGAGIPSWNTWAK